MKYLDFVDAGSGAGSQDTPEERTAALEYLQGIYNDATQSTSTRMRAAIESLPYETPKLSATAIATLDGKTFAEALERAIERSKGPVMLNGPTIEHEPLPASELKKPFVRSNYRRF
jgi:hypothetical protein